MSLRTTACIEPVFQFKKEKFKKNDLRRARQRQYMKGGTVEQHSKSCKMKRVKNNKNNMLTYMCVIHPTVIWLCYS